MKLQKKISIYFISTSLLIFAISSLASYFILKNLAMEEVDERLVAEQVNILTQLEFDNDSTKYLVNHSYIYDISPIEKEKYISPILSDTTLYLADEGEFGNFRQIKTSIFINGKNYQITLRQSIIEKEDLVTGITFLLISILFLIILSLNLINYYSEKKWWQPFYQTLEKLSKYKLSQNEKIHFDLSKIDEFNTLNRNLEEMTNKFRNDYNLLKEFGENSSHEMQTPLAIIRSKLDLMIQDKFLSEKQFDSIRSIYDAVNRLSRLNQSLNLLAKIENEEFSQKESINFSQVIKKQLANFEELISLNSLNVLTEMKDDVTININPFVAETLISNLLTNSIKHNLRNGEISIILSKNLLVIKNTGNPLKTPPAQLFNRFKKEAQTSDSTGLGLSIVKTICELNDLEIKYNYLDEKHRIELIFESF
jgi:signal transduction histidine kinase